jgi:hypothetical protein
MSQRIFIPFRQQYTDANCTNDFLKKFMRGEKDLTLSSLIIVLGRSRETALQNFIGRMYPDAAARVFGPQGLVNILNGEEMRDIRNKAAHDEVLRRAEAQQTRTRAMKLLGQVWRLTSARRYTGEENRDDYRRDFTTGKDTERARAQRVG